MYTKQDYFFFFFTVSPLTCCFLNILISMKLIKVPVKDWTCNTKGLHALLSTFTIQDCLKADKRCLSAPVHLANGNRIVRSTYCGSKRLFFAERFQCRVSNAQAMFSLRLRFIQYLCGLFTGVPTYLKSRQVLTFSV